MMSKLKKKEQNFNKKYFTQDDIAVWKAVASTVDSVQKKEENFKEILEQEALKKEEKLSPPKVKLAPKKREKDEKFADVFEKKRLFQSTAKKALSHGDVADIDKKTATNFVKGKMKIDARLDLHGLTEAQAYDALISFVSNAYGVRKRCLLVITGKGKKAKHWYEQSTGVLKMLVPKWLNQPPIRPMILSFSYASKSHGGDGALYVLLKRQRN
jgi:DNA-nicking Smr family endonuclease